MAKTVIITQTSTGQLEGWTDFRKYCKKAGISYRYAEKKRRTPKVDSPVKIGEVYIHRILIK